MLYLLHIMCAWSKTINSLYINQGWSTGDYYDIAHVEDGKVR